MHVTVFKKELTSFKIEFDNRIFISSTKLLLLLVVSLQVFGCSITQSRGALITPDAMRVSLERLDLQSEQRSKSTDDKLQDPKLKGGVSSNEGRLLVKAKGKSFVSILDEVARIRRFNYTVLGDISKFYVDYFDIPVDQRVAIKFQPGILNEKYWDEKILAQEFSSVDEFVEASISEIKAAYLSSNDEELRKLATALRYRWSGDGFVFYMATGKLSAQYGATPSQIIEAKKANPNSGDAPNLTDAQPDLIAPVGIGYKKIFLYNLSEREVAFYLSRLYDIPYSTFTPNRSAELPRREVIGQLGGASASSNIKNAEDTTPKDSSSWALFDSSSNRVQSNTFFSSMRWITIPQQNAILLRGSAEQLDQVGQVLHSIDSDYKQIVLEAKVFEYDASMSKKIGLALGNVAGGLSVKQPIGNATISVERVFGADVANALPLNFYYLSAIERRFALLSALTLYARDGLVRISAEPRMLLKPGQVSTMDITTSKFVQPNSTGAAVASLGGGYLALQPIPVQAGVFFTVRPTLLSDQKVQLDLFIKQSEFTASNERNVLISTSENQMATSIIASHGELVSLGGLDSKKYSFNNSGVPGLKDLNAIGGAFGSTEEDASLVRVEFMLRPIIRDIENDQKIRISNVKDLNRKIEDFIKSKGIPKDAAMEERK